MKCPICNITELNKGETSIGRCFWCVLQGVTMDHSKAWKIGDTTTIATHTVLRVHVLPVGDEHCHAAQASCWCRPTKDKYDTRLYVHHAKDCREKYERQNKCRDNYRGEGWVNILERVPIVTMDVNYSRFFDRSIIQRIWKRTMCRLGFHMFDQVASEGETYLICDACGKTFDGQQAYIIGK